MMPRNLPLAIIWRLSLLVSIVVIVLAIGVYRYGWRPVGPKQLLVEDEERVIQEVIEDNFASATPTPQPKPIIQGTPEPTPSATPTPTPQIKPKPKPKPTPKPKPKTTPVPEDKELTDFLKEELEP